MVAHQLPSNSQFVIPAPDRSQGEFDEAFRQIVEVNAPEIYDGVLPDAEQARLEVLGHYPEHTSSGEAYTPSSENTHYLETIEAAAHDARGYAQTAEAMRAEPEVRAFRVDEIGRAGEWLQYLRSVVTQLPENHPTAAAIPNKPTRRFGLKKLARLLTGPGIDNITEIPHLTVRQLIEHESEIGRNLFPDRPTNEQWEFFNLDPMTWVWSKTLRDKKDAQATKIMRYEIHQNGILKVTDGADYRYLDEEEMRHFGMTVHLYYNEVMRGIYKRDPQTGEPLDVPHAASDFALAA